MSKRILILDDDLDFTALLDDIFRQSGYATVVFNEPHRALAALRAEAFDLLVTDHRMPGMTGETLVRELRKSHPALPVIVISGFLDNETIRDLIRDGVGGIFIKPLNIVNLLKRTTMLLDEVDLRAGRKNDANDADFEHSLPFPFKAFPCRATKSAEFARALHAKRHFKGNLTLVCPPGIPLRPLLADLENFDPEIPRKIIPLTNRAIRVDIIREHLESFKETGKLGSFAFQNLDFAAPETRRLVIELGTAKGAFADLETPPGLVFAFTHPVDELYERGKIEEALYVLASVTEIRVPSLADCPEDITVLACRYLRGYCASANIDPELRLDRNALIWIKEQPWPGNIEELFARVISAAHLPHAGAVTRDSFEAAIIEHQWAGGPVGVHALHDYLLRLRDDYVQAMLILCDNDADLTAQALGAPRHLVEKIRPARQPESPRK